MMSHAIWKGHISFGLVNIPVILYSAEKDNELHFKMLDGRDLNKIRFQRINEQTGKEVPWESIVKGYEYDNEHYVVLTSKDFEEVAMENLKTIEIEDFVPQNQIGAIYFETPYYLLPDKRGDKGYVLLREILNKTKKVGIARIMIKSKQYIAAILPYEDAIIVNILRYPEELKKPKEFELPNKNIKEYKISKKEIDIAEQLISTMSVAWKPERYHNEYRDALMHLIDQKAKSGNKPIKKKGAKHHTTKQTNIIDFMELLKKSVKQKKHKSSPPEKKSPHNKKK